MRYIVNPVTGEYESTAYTFRDRFALGGRVSFDKGGSAQVFAHLNSLPEGTEIDLNYVRKFVEDNNIDADAKNVYNQFSEVDYKRTDVSGKKVFKYAEEKRNLLKRIKNKLNFKSLKKTIPATTENLEELDNLIKNTNLNIEQIGEKLGYENPKSLKFAPTKRSTLAKAYIKKYGELPEGRFRYSKLTAETPKVKQAIKLKDTGLSTRQVARELGVQQAEVINYFRLGGREDLIGEVPAKKEGTPIDRTKKARKENIAEGQKFASKSDKIFNQAEDLRVQKINAFFKNNSDELANNKKFINLVNLKLDGKGNIISKNKNSKEIAELLKKDRLFERDHISSVAKRKRNMQFPVNFQMAPQNINQGFFGAVESYVNRPDADPEKIKKISNVLDQYGLRISTNKGIIGAKQIPASKVIDRNLNALGLSTDIGKSTESVVKKGSKIKAALKAAKPGLKALPVVGTAIGLYDMGKAVQAGVRNPIDLYAAYEVSPEVALKNKAMREDKTGKLVSEEISNLPDISAEASLMDDLTPYGKFLQEGGQLSFEEFQKMRSIPQSDRPITGSIDIPEMDGTMMAAQGGRVNFENGSGSLSFSDTETDTFIDMAIAADQNDNIPIEDKTFLGMKLADNPLQRFNEMIDPRAYPYYGQKIVEGAANIPEYAVRTLPALGQLSGDLIKGRKSGKYDRFMEAISPTVTEGLKEKYGDYIGIGPESDKAAEKNRTGAQQQMGGQLEFLAEIPGPVTPFAFLLKTPKYFRQLRGLAGSTQAAKELERQIEEKIAVDQGRRDFNMMLGTGGVVALVKALGLDKFISVGSKVAQKTAPIVTQGGTPKYFFDFVSLIKKSGDDITEKASTLERQKVYDYNGYTMYEDLTSGEIRINKQSEGMSSGTDEFGEVQQYDTITGQEEIIYRPGEEILGKDGKAVKTLDEYEEATAKPVNPDGDMEGEAGLDSIEEILNLLRKDGKKYSKTELEDMGIDPDALGNYPTGAGSVRKETLLNPDIDTFTGKPKKAGGGIMKLAGDDSGTPPKSGPNSKGLNSEGLALILKRGRKY